MLERWYDPTSGTVKVDGKNTKNVYLKSLRRDMALVGQEPVLFDMSIRENLLFGSDREDISQEELEEVSLRVVDGLFVDDFSGGQDGQHSHFCLGSSRQIRDEVI